MKKCAQTWSKQEDEEKSQLQSKSCIQLTDVFCCTFACYYNVYATISMSTNAINVVIPWKQTQKRVSWNNLEWMSSKKNSVKRGTQGKEFFTASTEPQEKKRKLWNFLLCWKVLFEQVFFEWIVKHECTQKFEPENESKDLRCGLSKTENFKARISFFFLLFHLSHCSLDDEKKSSNLH